MTGLFEGIASFGGDTLVGMGPSLFAASYDAAGQHRWSRRYGEAETSDHICAIAADAWGNAVQAGYFNTEIRFGADTFKVAGAAGQDADAFDALLDPTGAPRVSKGFGTMAPDGFFDVAVDPAGDVLMVGVSFGGALDLGTGPLPAAGLAGRLHLCRRQAEALTLLPVVFGLAGNTRGSGGVVRRIAQGRPSSPAIAAAASVSTCAAGPWNSRRRRGPTPQRS